MNKDRILIGDTWYVKEEKIKPIVVDPIQSRSITWETDEFVFEAVQLYKKDWSSVYEDFDIEITDKRMKGGKTEFWDNMNWFKGIVDNNPDSLPEALEYFGNDLDQFIAFLKYLREVENWL